MTTTKPPVPTDELDPRLIEWLRARQDQHHVLLDQPAVRQMIAVLERAGGDAVRDAALEEAIEAVGTVTWSVGNSVAGELASEWTGQSMSEARDAIRALKGTPAAAEYPGMRDAYAGAREDLADWKRRALAAEDLNRKFMREVNGPTFMGEPAAAVADALPVRLMHMAVADEDGLRWMTGRKMPAGMQSCELYAMPNGGRAPENLYAAPQAGQLSANAGEFGPASGNPATDLLAYVLQDDMHNRLTPRVIDIAYSAFMSAKRPNDEDGGPSDWYTDTRPMVREAIDKLRKDLFENRAAIAASKGAKP